MEIGRPSNLGTLVSAVLVGLLSLASNQYARMDRQALDDFVTRLARSDSAKVPAVTVDSVRAEIEKTDTQLIPLFDRWMRREPPDHDPQLEQILAELTHWWTELQTYPEVQQALSLADHRLILRILFMAGEICPRQYSDEFLLWANQLAQSSDESTRAEVAALCLYQQHDFLRPDATQLITDLDRFTCDHRDPQYGVRLYSMIAYELCRFGHTGVAQKVLQHGAEVYRNDVHVRQLINELIDLQVRTQWR